MALRQISRIQQLLLWLLAALALCSTPANAATVCPDSKVCYSTTILKITKQDGTIVDGIELSINTTAGGWVGFGIGSAMADADIVVVEPVRASGAAKVTDMRSRGERMPDQDVQQDWTSVKVNPSGQYVLRRALETGDADDKAFVRGKQNYIWAYGSAAATLAYHGTTRGTIQLDVFDATGTGEAVAGRAFSMVLTHGLLMFFAWSVFSYFGIWAAKFGKPIFGKKWFPIHVGALLVGTGALCITAFIVIVVQRGGLYFTSVHNILGFLIVIAMIVQIILGKVIDKMYQPDRLTVPARDKAHWWLGRFLAVAAVINIFLGLAISGAAKALFAVFAVWIVIVCGIFGFSQYQVNMREKKRRGLGNSGDVGLRYEGEVPGSQFGTGSAPRSKDVDLRYDNGVPGN